MRQTVPTKTMTLAIMVIRSKALQGAMHTIILGSVSVEKEHGFRVQVWCVDISKFIGLYLECILVGSSCSRTHHQHSKCSL